MCVYVYVCARVCQSFGGLLRFITGTLLLVSCEPSLHALVVNPRHLSYRPDHQDSLDELERVIVWCAGTFYDLRREVKFGDAQHINRNIHLLSPANTVSE